MTFDVWLPMGHLLPDGARTGRPLYAGAGWQIVETQGEGRALLVEQSLVARWIGSGFIEEGALAAFQFGSLRLAAISSGQSQTICPVSDGKSPNTKAEALAFAMALKATRNADKDSPLQDALYVEKISRLLPTYSISSRTDDAIVLGYWLTGGASVSAKSFRRLSHMLSWLGPENLKQVVEAAGMEVSEIVPAGSGRPCGSESEASGAGRSVSAKERKDEGARQDAFSLPGRPELEAFFNEHVVDIIQNRERYRALGIEFPSAIVLHGPPGCGKTFAVERLVNFLGWPSFQIDASSVASPYIHETSRKVAAVFDKAMEDAPSVLVIDEMEAFLADREMGTGHHRVEEVAEFLRRIPEATKRDVLIIAMTNRVEMIDPAILRRGRFDHVIKVEYASEQEVHSLVSTLLAFLPKHTDVNIAPLAKELGGRPLSDVTFVVREAARLAARAGKSELDQESLLNALRAAPAREREGGERRRIGFI